MGVPPADLGWTEPKLKRERPRHEDEELTSLPIIQIVAGGLHTNTTAAEDASIEAGTAMYQRGSDLVQPVSREVPTSDGRMTLAAELSELNVAALIDVLCAVAEWRRYDARAKGLVRTNLPPQVAEILLSRFGQWWLSAVAGVITTPPMRPVRIPVIAIGSSGRW